MADSVEVSSQPPAIEEQGGGEGGGGSEMDAGGGLTDAQTEVLERCLHALKHAKNDSLTLAALLLVSRQGYIQDAISCYQRFACKANTCVACVINICE